jgi:hypothetical protein
MRREAMAAALIGLDAAGAALLADDLLDEGETLQAVWRYAIVQLLDDYSRDLARAGASIASARFDARAGASIASARFDREPPATRSTEVDAALAALAEHFARRDNWPLPSWARKPGRYSTKWWFVTPLRGMHPTALQESPPSFRTRGIFITAGALSRV